MVLIVELESADLQLMGALLHAFLKKHPDNKNGKRMLKSLVEQTDVVRSSPTFHPMDKYEKNEADPSTPAERMQEYYRTMIMQSSNVIE